MTIEDFFTAVAEHPDVKRIDLNIGPALEGGWRIAAHGGVSWGDTIEEGIQAAYDHLMRSPSQHSAVQDLSRGGGCVIAYDYRRARRVT